MGEPDIGVIRNNGAGGSAAQTEIRAMDIYDPVKAKLRANRLLRSCLNWKILGRSVADISYWRVDDAYDGANFWPTQMFFFGGDADEFDKFKRRLNNLAIASPASNTMRNAGLNRTGRQSV